LIRYDFITDEQDIQSAIWNVSKEPIVQEQGEKCMLNLIKNDEYHNDVESYLDKFDLERIKDFHLPIPQSSLPLKPIERKAV